MTRAAPPLAGLLVALVACLGADCGQQRPPEVAEGPRRALVDVVRVDARDVDDVARATAAVEPFSTSDLSAEVAGTIAALDVEIGQPLAKGDLVAAIDDEAYRIAVQRATAVRDGAKAAVAEATQNHAREHERFDSKLLFEQPLRVARFLRTIALADRNTAAATHRDAKRKLARARELSGKGVTAQSDLDAAVDAEEAARERVGAAETRLKQADDAVERQEKVFASPLLSRGALDTAATQLAAAKAQAASAQADLDAAATSLRDCRILAPFAGQIASKHVELGQRVAPGSPVATLVDVSRVKLAVGLPDIDRVRVRAGTPATVAVDAYPGLVREGAVAHLAPVAAEDTGTFTVELIIANGDDRPLLPGMMARVGLLLDRYRDAILVPRDAVVPHGDGHAVYVVASQNPGGPVARRRTVTVARTLGTRALIASGLEPGDRVIVLGHRAVRDAMPVRVRDSSAPAPRTPRSSTGDSKP